MLVELQRIFKYDLKIIDEQTIDVPQFATPIKVAMQEGQLKMWCQVTPSRPLIKYTIYIFGTGHNLPYKALNYLESVIDDRGLVWHIYLEVD